jgi:hypothetical protein
MVTKPWYVKKPVSSVRKTASYVKKTKAGTRSTPDRSLTRSHLLPSSPSVPCFHRRTVVLRPGRRGWRSVVSCRRRGVPAVEPIQSWRWGSEARTRLACGLSMVAGGFGTGGLSRYTFLLASSAHRGLGCRHRVRWSRWPRAAGRVERVRVCASSRRRWSQPASERIDHDAPCEQVQEKKNWDLGDVRHARRREIIGSAELELRWRSLHLR